MAAPKMSKREMMLAVGATGGIVFYLFFQFLISPKLAEIGKLGNQISRSRQELRIAESKIKLLEEMEKNLGAAPTKKTIMELPDDKKALESLRALSSATSKSKLNVDTIRPILKEGEGMKFDLTCVGTYGQLYDFLKIMHEMEIMMLIDSMQVAGDVTKNPKLMIKIILSVH